MEQMLFTYMSMKARDLAKKTDLDVNIILIAGFIGSLMIVSIVITFLVWMRYLMIIGLVITSVVAGIRWRRGDHMGITH